jgi:hypothetical protein
MEICGLVIFPVYEIIFGASSKKLIVLLKTVCSSYGW